MSTYQQLVKTLVDNQTEPEEIAAMLSEVSRASALKLYTQITMAITPEEQQQMEAAQSEEEIDRLMDQFYQAHYNMTAEQAATELEEQFAQSFLESYNADKAIKTE